MSDPLDAARARGAQYRRALLDSPEMLREPDVLALLGITYEQLPRMREHRQVIALLDNGQYKGGYSVTSAG